MGCRNVFHICPWGHHLTWHFPSEDVPGTKNAGAYSFSVHTIQSPRLGNYVSSWITKLKPGNFGDRSREQGGNTRVCVFPLLKFSSTWRSSSGVMFLASLPLIHPLLQENKQRLNFVTEFWRRWHFPNYVPQGPGAPQQTCRGSVGYFQGKHNDTLQTPSLPLLLLTCLDLSYLIDGTVWKRCAEIPRGWEPVKFGNWLHSSCSLSLWSHPVDRELKFCSAPSLERSWWYPVPLSLRGLSNPQVQY